MSSFKPPRRVEAKAQNPIFPENVSETLDKFNEHHIISLQNKTKALPSAEVAFVVCISLCPETLLSLFENLKRNLKQSFQLFVVDDCQNHNDSTNLFILSQLIKVVYIRNLQNKYTNPVKRHMNALSYGFQHVLPGKFKYLGTLDSDLFLINRLDLDWIFEIYEAVGTRRADKMDKPYLWGGFAIWSSSKLRLDKARWELDEESGEITKRYINSDKVLWIDDMDSNTFKSYLPRSLQLYYNKFTDLESEIGFLNDSPLYIHMKNISNWAKQDVVKHRELVVCFLRAIDTMIPNKS